MILTFVVPDLIWPRQIMRDVLYDADFPALQTLLGKGTPLRSAASAGAWWSAHFGIAESAFAAAPLRLAATGMSAGEDRWLCADPVHLRVDPKGATLGDPALLNIDALEARQLHETLAPLFAEVGELVIATPSQWHLRLTAPAPALPANLGDVIGAPATALLPAGDAGRPWRQLINETQMALHTHPVNTARGEHGKSLINSLALWGEGRAPVPRAADRSMVYSADHIVIGAGKLAGVATAALPPRFSPEIVAGDGIVNWDTLRFPTSSRDALAWRDGLQQLENDWLTPALDALDHGALKRIVLHGFGDGRGVSTAFSAFDRYRFWRQPRRLEAMLENP